MERSICHMLFIAIKGIILYNTLKLSRFARSWDSSVSFFFFFRDAKYPENNAKLDKIWRNSCLTGIDTFTNCNEQYRFQEEFNAIKRNDAFCVVQIWIQNALSYLPRICLSKIFQNILWKMQKCIVFFKKKYNLN